MIGLAVIIVCLVLLMFYKRDRENADVLDEAEIQNILSNEDIALKELVGIDKEAAERLAIMYNNGQSGARDSDGDGITDEDEKNYRVFTGSMEDIQKAGLDPQNITEKDIEKLDSELFLVLNPENKDTDGDGASDGEEIFKYFTDPWDQDSDGDGILDGEEIAKYNTLPNNPDTDGDILSDYDEIFKYKTDPLKADTDGDGFRDDMEISNGFNPSGEGKLE